MICEKCRQAGRLNAEANRNGSEFTKQLAVGCHAECPGGTWCDCQHVVGHVIDRTKTNAGT